MPIKKLTLSVALCVAAVSPAFAGNHTVASGDTLLDIAKRYRVPARDILRANDLSNIHQLKLGQVLVIPRQRSVARQTTAKMNSTTVGNATYVVRNGDHDWNIAAKVGLTPSQLRTLNPQLNWRRLQIGQKINVGRSAASLVAKAPAKGASQAASGFGSGLHRSKRRQRLGDRSTAWHDSEQASCGEPRRLLDGLKAWAHFARSGSGSGNSDCGGTSFGKADVWSSDSVSIRSNQCGPSFGSAWAYYRCEQADGRCGRGSWHGG